MNQSSLVEPDSLTGAISSLALSKGTSSKAIQHLNAGAPFACYQMLQDTIPSEHQEVSGYYTGKVGGRRRTSYGIELATVGLDEECFGTLPLDGHSAVPSWGIYSWVEEALLALEERDIASLEYITKWCRLIVWLQKIAESKHNEITSVAIPSMPFCVFVTRKAIRHIPPKTIIKYVGLYALQENIFHECAHQELSAFLLTNDLLAERAVGDVQIDIPWRNTSWPIDRALHAAFVYSKLSEFRQLALKQNLLHLEEQRAVATAQKSGKEALNHLVSCLSDNLNVLSPAGVEVFSRLAG